MTMIKIGTKEYEAVSARIYPSNSPMARASMRIEFSNDMTDVEFAETRKQMVLAESINVSGAEYTNFTHLTAYGKQEVSDVALETGEVVKEMRCFIELQQLTFIEQQLAMLGIRL
jgi:hypothetical protein